ncbi:hypothetical protein LM597_00110 [Candidatus Acetothermia bacterium]|nr:hypothetical protein [Candidatus Acetothermia bacterium]
MNNRLLPRHTEDLRRSGLNDETIEALTFYSGTPAQVRAILGFDAGPGLVIPYPEVAGQNPFWRVKPDNPPIIDNKPAHHIARILLFDAIRAKNEYVQERKTTQLPTQSLGLIKEMESRTQKSRRRVVTCQALTKEH